MSYLNDIQNMGFSEIPVNAVKAFNLEEYEPPHPLLTRSYKATCPLCYKRSHTYERHNRISLCFACEKYLIPSIQGIARGFLVRKKLQRLRKKELVFICFFKNGLNGGDFSKIIIKFL